MSPIDWLVCALGMILQGMVVSTMLKGSFRRYVVIFIYLVFSILSTVVQFSVRYYYGPDSKIFIRAYWIGDFLGTVLVLLIIIRLIRLALDGHRYRGSVYWGLLMGVVATAGATVVLMSLPAKGFSLGRWMTEMGRDYYFAAVLLNAILWLMLTRARHVNKQVFLLTSGLGLKLSGAAVAHALRLVGIVRAADVFLILAYLANLYIWYIALKKFPTPAPAVAAAGPAPLGASEEERGV